MLGISAWSSLRKSVTSDFLRLLTGSHPLCLPRVECCDLARIPSSLLWIDRSKLHTMSSRVVAIDDEDPARTLVVVDKYDKVCAWWVVHDNHQNMYSNILGLLQESYLFLTKLQDLHYTRRFHLFLDRRRHKTTRDTGGSNGTLGDEDCKTILRWQSYFLGIRLHMETTIVIWINTTNYRRRQLLQSTCSISALT